MDFEGNLVSLALAAVRIGEAEAPQADCYHRWLASGGNAGMDYLQNWGELRRSPELLLPGARTMFTGAIPFPLAIGGGSIASYALGLDYHDLIRALYRETETRQTEFGWRLCVDSAPVFERYWAVRSGLGRRTASGMVAVDGFGTGCFLFEILTTATLEDLGLPGEGLLKASDISSIFSLEAEVPELQTRGLKPSECTECGLCHSSCPSSALGQDGVNANKCLSYLTIEHRGEFRSPQALEAMDTPAGRQIVFGCDLCLRVCPLNALPFRDDRELHFLPGLKPNPAVAALTREDCLAMSQEDFSRLFKGSPVKRAKLAGLQRNCRPVKPVPQPEANIRHPGDVDK